MTNPRYTLPARRATTILVALLYLVGGSWLVGVHHHDDASAHPCVVCTTAHAPAIVSLAPAALDAPRPLASRVILAVALAPVAVPAGGATQRGPPSA